MKFSCLSVGGMLRTVGLRFGLRLEVCGTKVSIKGKCFGLHVKRIGIASLQSRVLPYTSHLAERPPKHEQRSGGYCAQPPRSKSRGKQASPPQAVAGSTRRGLRVGVVNSFGGSFVGGLLQLWIAHLAARPTRRGTMSGGNLTQSSIVRSQDARLGTPDHGPCAADHGPLVLAL